jgi:trans-2,3-dihydro-3-hydroxyanthranilate isomerase
MTDERRALLVDAFTDTALAGNVAGVVPDGGGLTDSQMQAIARELGASETAFLLPGDEADRAIRYFTPTREIDLCGHATVASLGHLYDAGQVGAGAHQLETPVGMLDVDVTDAGVVWMTQQPPNVEEITVDLEDVASILDVPPAGVTGVELPVAVASTGLPFVIVPVTFLELLGDASPDMDALEAFAERHDAAGVYAFTFDTISADSTLHGRCFVPGAGVPEDPVTGTASGATGAYLRRVEAFESLPAEMRFEQGHFLERPGEVRVEAREDIRVGGTTVTAFDGTLAVPEAAEDEILGV